MDNVAGLRELAADCNLWPELESNMQTEMLRDRKLTLDLATGIAQSQEETDGKVTELKLYARSGQSSSDQCALRVWLRANPLNVRLWLWQGAS